MANIIKKLAIFMALCCSIGYAKPPKKISSGIEVLKNEIPYIVSLQNNSGHFCAGVIIDPSFILTTGHCVVEFDTVTQQSIPRKDLVVLSNTKNQEDQSSGEIYHPVIAFYPTSFHFTLKDDIGIIALDRPIQFGKSQNRIEMADDKFVIPAKAPVTITGWGRRNKTTPYLKNLNILKTNLFDTKQCYDFFKSSEDESILPSILCTLDEPGKSLCYGDSGGPVVNKDKLVGIISSGFDDNCSQYPEVLTRVSYFQKWIESSINFYKDILKKKDIDLTPEDDGSYILHQIDLP